MDIHSSFPPLPTSHPSSSNSGIQINHANSTSVWKDLLLAQNEKSQSLPLSFIPSDDPAISFSADELAEGQKEWNLSLIGHAIGKRPYYGSLLAAVRKKWKFRGSLDLLTLEGDYFLFKFTCSEDYQLVWDSGPCFLNGRPFVFQKWTWDFRPSKEQISELPIWIKLPNFPLCLWNELGFSKVASRVGTPLAVDNLTASKARITFARICVQVNTSSSFPNSIPINLNGKEFNQDVIYDWKLSVCSKCCTFSHGDQNCPLQPSPTNPNRGRSRSRVRATGPANGPRERLPRSDNASHQTVVPPTSTNAHLHPEINHDHSMEKNNLSQPAQIAIHDLNHSPILSPVTDDSIDVEEENVDHREHTELTHNETIPGSSHVGVITRSAAASPNRGTMSISTDKGAKTPSINPMEGDHPKSLSNQSPSTQKGNKKKGKKPATSSSQ